MAEIKFCENNFSFGTEGTMKKLKEQNSELDISIEGCLGYCGECAEGPYALVDDEFVQAGSADELFDKINAMI